MQNNQSVDSLEKFYTKTDVVIQCYDLLVKFLIQKNIELKNIYFIEPSAGGGAFLKVLKKNGNDCIGFDILPEKDENGKNVEDIITLDYLTDDIRPYLDKNENFKNKLPIVIGNPPFGKRGSSAIKFLNKSFEYSNIVAFILPNSINHNFSQNNINFKYSAANEKIELCKNSFMSISNGLINDINCSFQIWSSNEKEREKIPHTIKYDHDFFDFVKTIEEADFAMRRAGNGKYGNGVGQLIKANDWIENSNASAYFFIKSKIDANKLYGIFKACYEEVQKVSKKNTTVISSIRKLDLIEIISQKCSQQLPTELNETEDNSNLPQNPFFHQTQFNQGPFNNTFNSTVNGNFQQFNNPTPSQNPFLNQPQFNQAQFNNTFNSTVNGNFQQFNNPPLPQNPFSHQGQVNNSVTISKVNGNFQQFNNQPLPQNPFFHQGQVNNASQLNTNNLLQPSQAAQKVQQNQVSKVTYNQGRQEEEKIVKKVKPSEGGKFLN